LLFCSQGVWRERFAFETEEEIGANFNDENYEQDGELGDYYFGEVLLFGGNGF
jgi:hypothetical protein